MKKTFDDAPRTPQRDGESWDRRRFLQTIPAAYLAPATLMLVTADRAAAQSAVCQEVAVEIANLAGQPGLGGPETILTVNFATAAGPQTVTVPPLTPAIFVQACLGSSITFSATEPINVQWECGGSFTDTGLAPSHTLTVQSSGCIFFVATVLP